MMRWTFRLLVIALFVYEGVALWTPASGDTISEIVWGLGVHPFFPFMAGFLCGHFFWQRKGTP